MPLGRGVAQRRQRQRHRRFRRHRGQQFLVMQPGVSQFGRNTAPAHRGDAGGKVGQRLLSGGIGVRRDRQTVEPQQVAQQRGVLVLGPHEDGPGLVGAMTANVVGMDGPGLVFVVQRSRTDAMGGLSDRSPGRRREWQAPR